MKRFGNILLAGCVLLLLALTAGMAAAVDDNGTGNVTDNAAGNAADNITDNAATGEDVAVQVTDENIEDGDGELADDIEPYDGSVGPGNALYGLKIAFENIDMAFTFNESEKLGKQVSRARARISEAKAELRKNNQEAANKALELYGAQIESINRSAAGFSGNNSGLFNAQKNIVKHQYVLAQLLEANPNNTGLQRAYNNSLRQEEKFEEKTERKLERMITKDNRVRLKTVKKEQVREREEIEVKAEVSRNTTKVKVKVEFVSSSSDNNTLAQEILDRMKMERDAISGLIKIESKDKEESGDTVEKLKAEAETVGAGTKVEAGYEFSLDTADETGIVDGIAQKLSSLTSDEILAVLKMEITEMEDQMENSDNVRGKGRDIEDKEMEKRGNIKGNKGRED
jgi:hypothetical protein